MKYTRTEIDAELQHRGINPEMDESLKAEKAPHNYTENIDNICSLLGVIMVGCVAL